MSDRHHHLDGKTGGGKRFLTPSGKVELYTPALETELAPQRPPRATRLLHPPRKSPAPTRRPPCGSGSATVTPS